mmetsp:Transcript_59287/g.126045  ORF Transcript_59287/g.126045 Transcript_59287/m.126045 type:complete len:330 (+) Transcript_59287:977-1966(+)
MGQPPRRGRRVRPHREGDRGVLRQGGTREGVRGAHGQGGGGAQDGAGDQGEQAEGGEDGASPVGDQDAGGDEREREACPRKQRSRTRRRTGRGANGGRQVRAGPDGLGEGMRDRPDGPVHVLVRPRVHPRRRVRHPGRVHRRPHLGTVRGLQPRSVLGQPAPQGAQAGGDEGARGEAQRRHRDHRRGEGGEGVPPGGGGGGEVLEGLHRVLEQQETDEGGGEEDEGEAEQEGEVRRRRRTRRRGRRRTRRRQGARRTRGSRRRTRRREGRRKGVHARGQEVAGINTTSERERPLPPDSVLKILDAGLATIALLLSVWALRRWKYSLASP